MNDSWWHQLYRHIVVWTWFLTFPFSELMMDRPPEAEENVPWWYLFVVVAFLIALGVGMHSLGLLEDQ